MKDNNKVISYSMYHHGIWKKVHGIDWNIEKFDKSFEKKSIRDLEKEMYSWTDKEWNLAAGRYQYTKLFADDLDEDGKLELLFWHKRYRANDKKDGLGFFLEKDYFTLYKENSAGSGFIKSQLDEGAGLTLLDLKKKSWNDGWPNDDHLCSNKMQSDPRGKRGLTEDKLVSPVNFYQGD